MTAPLLSVTRLGPAGRETFEIGHGPDDVHVITLTRDEAEALAARLRAELDWPAKPGTRAAIPPYTPTYNYRGNP